MAESHKNFPVNLETAKDRVMGDMDFLKEMLVLFEESIPTFLEGIRDAIEHHDAPALSRMAHQLKGASSNLSVLKVAEKAADLDELGKKADFEKAEEALKALELAVSDFREYMINEPW